MKSMRRGLGEMLSTARILLIKLVLRYAIEPLLAICLIRHRCWQRPQLEPLSSAS
jgi:hypothetical protein